MRILLAVHQFFPRFHFGTETYTLTLAQELQRRGHTVSVLCADLDPEDTTHREIRRYEYEGVPVIALNLVDRAALMFAESYIREDLEPLYREVLAAERPDLLHATHLLNLGVNLLKVAHEAGIPVVNSFTDFWGFCFTGQLVMVGESSSCRGPGLANSRCVADFCAARGCSQKALQTGQLDGTKLSRKILGSAIGMLPFGISKSLVPGLDAVSQRNPQMLDYYRLATRYWAPTNFLLRKYVAQGFDANRFRQQSWGIPLPSEAQRTRRRKRLAATKRPLRLGYIGQIAQNKGVHILLDALGTASFNRPVSTHIYGQARPNDDYALKQVNSRLSSSADIHAEGTFNYQDIYSVLAELDAVVIPSLWHENAPLVLLNALALGIPLLISDAAGMTEYVEHKQNGLIHSQGNSTQLRRQLEQFVAQGGTLPQADPDQPGYSLSIADHTTILEQDYHQLIAANSAAPYSASWIQKARRRPDPVQISKVKPHGQRIERGHLDSLTRNLIQTRTTFAQLKLPLVTPLAPLELQANNTAISGRVGSSIWDLMPSRRQMLRKVRTNTDLSRRFHPETLGISVHEKTEPELQAMNGVSIRFERIQDIDKAAGISLVFRRNQGKLGSFDYRSDPDAEWITLLKYQLPHKSWVHYHLDLRRAQGLATGSSSPWQLRWMPFAAGRSYWKIQLGEIRLMDGAEMAQASRERND